MLKTFNGAKLLLTDTGSLVYEIYGKDIYEQCFKNKELFDFSGYPINSEYFLNERWKMQNEKKQNEK